MKTIIAIFKDEEIVLNYSELQNEYGVNDLGYIDCKCKCRVYGNNKSGHYNKGYNLQTVKLSNGGIINGNVEIEFTDDFGKLNSAISDLLLIDGTEAIWATGGVSNTTIYQNK